MRLKEPTGSDNLGTGMTPLFFPTPARWRTWLRQNQGRQQGTWVLLAKKGTRPGIGYVQALEEALCWGWIDGKVHAHDEKHFAQWFSPRRKRSVWSLANRKTVQRLSKAGRMQPAGLARVREAKESGRWGAAYTSAAPPRMTDDVRAALAASGQAEAWLKLAPSHRLRLMYWIADARKPETRARRIAQLPVLVRERRLAGFSA
jgi:uncharacterized protein YdeI (YjbR/CyaY-like superfamily)